MESKPRRWEVRGTCSVFWIPTGKRRCRYLDDLADFQPRGVAGISVRIREAGGRNSRRRRARPRSGRSQGRKWNPTPAPRRKKLNQGRARAKADDKQRGTNPPSLGECMPWCPSRARFDLRFQEFVVPRANRWTGGAGSSKTASITDASAFRVTQRLGQHPDSRGTL